MPCKIKVKVLAGRNLPVMDRASDTTDAFVEIKFGGVTHKTDVCRKSLNPHWNSTEWYRFEVDESELQDEPLQLRLMDHDTYSANDAIGKVVISLAPLLAREANNVKGTGPPAGAVMSGWIPVFDTMHGIRGELNVIVKVELFSDFNKYKTSSCGVQFFHCPMIPPGYRASSIHGFVEELVVNDDPEYQWIDKIRTPRASNEARQVAFIKLSNQVQRLVGLKASELGANAVVGYQQDFDLEGEAGVVARAIGTAVSITPLPTPSQPINITCTQQQLKKCLDILATDDETVTDLSQYYQTHQEELQKMLTILNPKAPSMLDEPDIIDDDDDKVERTRAASLNSYAGSVSIYQDDYVSQKSLRHLSEDQTDLNKLLSKRDENDSDSSGPIKKIKNLKKNFFTKKFNKRKSDKQDDTVSIKSNTSDTSRMSIADIKNEFKILKKLKKPKFIKKYANKEDEGEGMASILARSVIHARTNLACIAETHDSDSLNSAIRKTSESDPNMGLQEDDKSRTVPTDKSDQKTKTEVPEIHFTSLKNISTEDVAVPRERKTSESCPTSPMSGRNENLLKLPGDKGYFGSVSSALSGDSSAYSSSDENYESSETDTDGAFETTTSVVKSVLNHEVNPAFIAQMERKLSILENVHPNVSEVKAKDEIILPNIQPIEIKTEVTPPPATKTEETKIEISGDNSKELSTSPKETWVKPNTHHIKLHNPFADRKPSTSFSAPSSPVEKHGFVYRSGKRIKRQLSIISKSRMIKSLSHSLLHKKKQEKSLSQPGSTSNVPSRIPSETVLGSHFLSYSDLFNLDKDGFHPNVELCKSDEFDRSKFSMYIGSEPVSRASLSGPSFFHRDDHDHRKEKLALKPTGLIHTAMETILIDKVDTLLLPTSPNNTNRKFFDDVSEKLEEHKNKEFASKEKMGQVQSAIASTAPRVVAVTPKRLSDDLSATSTEYTLFGHNKSKKGSKESLDVSIKSTIMDKVHSILPKTPDAILHLDNLFHRKPKSDVKSGGLVHTAMQTMLMDRAQSMIPDTPEKIPIRDPFDEHKPETKTKESTGLVHQAMQTMLIDKVQSVLPDGNSSIPINLDDAKVDTKSVASSDSAKSGSRHSAFDDHKHETKTKESTGLVHQAMQTMLIDKVQSVLPDGNSPISINLDDPKVDTKSVASSNSVKSGLLHSAVETILLDKVQSLLNPETEIIAEIAETQTDVQSRKSVDSLEVKSSGLIDTALKTMLVDRAQALITESLPIFEQQAEKDVPADNISTDSKGLVHTTMETVLADKIQTLFPKSDIIVGEIDNDVKQTDKSSVKAADQNATVDKPVIQTVFIKQVEPAPTTPELVIEDVESKEITDETDKIQKKLIRQDSVRSEKSPEMSNQSSNTQRPPVLQHFHPILSGLETIPSVSESSFERSIDSECDTNSASVCDNSHAACGFDRSERDRDKSDKDRGSPRHSRHESYGGREPVASVQMVQNSSLNSTSTPMGIHRRSSDSDLSVTPKGGSLNTSAANVGSGGGAILKPSMNSNNLDMLEYPFLTMTEYPTGFVVHIGGTVCSRSVKLVDGGGEASVRAAWWAELRTELRTHARALRCNAVIAYTETAAICEDVCVLSASGTAAVINLDCDFNADLDKALAGNKRETVEENCIEACSVAHVPYSPGGGPYRAELSTCGGCRRARVPAVLLSTCEKPHRLYSFSKAVTLTAVTGRTRRAGAGGEPGARDVSDVLPFLEYELHKLLLAKLRMQGANAIFGLQTQIAIGERCVMALASGTAFRLTALPPPTPPRIKASENDKEALEIQRALWDTFVANKAANGYDVGIPESTVSVPLGPGGGGGGGGGEAPVLELAVDKDACVLELDEAEDVETARLLCVRRAVLPAWSSSLIPAAQPPLAFAQVSRGRLVLQQSGVSCGAERCVSRALDAVAYKLRRLRPAALHAAFHLELPDDEIQLVVSGTAIPLVDPSKVESITENGSANHVTGDGDDDIFELDEEQLVKRQQPEIIEDKSTVNGQVCAGSVSLSTLGVVAGARVSRRVCALRLLFVRETTAVRELGGLSGFLHTFTCEVLAIVRAYTAALGGNALTSFYITQLMLQDNAHKNQGQCLLSVGGDVVHFTY